MISFWLQFYQRSTSRSKERMSSYCESDERLLHKKAKKIFDLKVLLKEARKSMCNSLKRFCINLHFLAVIMMILLACFICAFCFLALGLEFIFADLLIFFKLIQLGKFQI